MEPGQRDAILLDLEMEEGGREPRAFVLDGKGKEMDLPYSLQRGMQPC